MTSAANGQETSFFDENKGLIIITVLSVLGLLISIIIDPFELALVPTAILLIASFFLMLFVHGGRPGPFLSVLFKTCNKNYNQQFSKNFWDCRQTMTGSTMLAIFLFPLREQLVVLIVHTILLLIMGYSWYVANYMLKWVRDNPSDKTIESFTYSTTQFGLYVSVFTAIILAVYQLR